MPPLHFSFAGMRRGEFFTSAAARAEIEIAKVAPALAAPVVAAAVIVPSFAAVVVVVAAVPSPVEPAGSTPAASCLAEAPAGSILLEEAAWLQSLPA